MVVSFNLGPCSACQKAPADIRIGSRTCEGCGATYEQMCATCARKPCRNCKKGMLELRERVFPHSLFRAIADEDEEAVVGLLSAGSVDLDSITDRHGETALSLAARCKSSAIAAELCEKLIKLGASATARTKDHGRTALILMVSHRGRYHSKVAALLGSSINIQDDSGKTALMYAAEGAGMFASRRGNLSIASDLISLGADPLIQDSGGRTALGHAIASNDKGTNEEMITYLKDEMTRQVALREFRSRYTFDFDTKGSLNFSPSKKR
jgi:ankyrin repeat protein